MGFQSKFKKILSIKENEKHQSLADYNAAVKEFEQAAENLYECLKKKETYEEIQKEKLLKGIRVQDILQQQLFITSLEKMITHYQKLVQISRNKMQYFQSILEEKNIEVKKYEKLQEREYATFQENLQAIESRFMDELSIQQYLQKGN